VALFTVDGKEILCTSPKSKKIVGRCDGRILFAMEVRCVYSTSPVCLGTVSNHILVDIPLAVFFCTFYAD
jgi:hypothetical protein